MPDDFIDELRSTLDQGSVLSATRSTRAIITIMAGNPVPKPRAVVRPRTTEEVSPCCGSVTVKASRSRRKAA